MPRYIDADALLISADHLQYGVNGAAWVQLINDAPTIEAVPVVHGEWRQGKDFSAYPRVPFISTAYYCSNCEGEAYWDTDYGQQLFIFCPNCGADMRGESEDA